jgi:glycosyltransferase involved in cell wall biosynthesis
MSDAMATYDGIICFGGADWWYHNRGHYDIQMCRQFAQRVPVLYVNSIGVRMPTPGEGGVFFRRVARKLRSWSRGFRRIDRGFGVLSPISIPGRLGRAVSTPLLLRQVQRAAARMGITHPLVWVESPTAAPLLDSIEHVGLVYQRTDRYEELPGVDRALIEAYDRRLKDEAAVTLFCATYLYDRERNDCRARFVDHGVDYRRFVEAGEHGADPQDMEGLPHPRVGFVGGIDEHTFDVDLFLEVAAASPDITFVLVGGSSLPAGWCALSNVEQLGRKDHMEVAGYMSACDVLIMPWKQNEWIRACNPVKLKEYLAVGRPIVSTPFEELKRYDGFVEVAIGAASFAAAIRRALVDSGDGERRRERVAGETWAAKGQAVAAHLREAGYVDACTDETKTFG